MSVQDWLICKPTSRSKSWWHALEYTSKGHILDFPLRSDPRYRSSDETQVSGSINEEIYQ